MKVLDSRILLQVEKACTQKIGEIEIQVGVGEFEKATVIAVGPDLQEKGSIKEGDIVYIYPGAGKTIKHEGQEFRVVTTSEVIVIL